MARSGSLPGSRTSVPVKLVVAATAALVAWGQARRHRAVSEQRRAHAAEVEALRTELEGYQAATARLATELVPEAIWRVQQGAFENEALDSLVPDAVQEAKWGHAHQDVLAALVNAVHTQERLRDSAQRALVNLAHRVQAIVHQQARELRAMQDKHGDNHGFVDDLALLDHYNALTGRLFDSIAVLSGARPIQQRRNEVALFNVLRGAMSRVKDFQRVNLGEVAGYAVTGPAVEPLIHALAELLDNATHYSPPGSLVSLTAAKAESGVAITIDDPGLGLTDEARARAEAVLAYGSAQLDLDDLGETPRLGLAVVGRLSREYGFTVSLQSPVPGKGAEAGSGPGVRAVLTVPAELIVESTVADGEVVRAPSLPPARPRRAVSEIASKQPKEAKEPKEALENAPTAEKTYTPGGLPRRKRSGPSPTRAKSSQPTPESTAEAPGAWLGDFLGKDPGSSAQGTDTPPERED